MAFSARLALVVALTAAPAAQAGSLPSAKLVRCGAEQCLLVRGARRSPAATVTINDRIVQTTGRRGWSVRISLATVRTWTPPMARSLSVAVIDPTGQVEQREPVRLPVGLLGHNTELAALVVRAR